MNETETGYENGCKVYATNIPHTRTLFSGGGGLVTHAHTRRNTTKRRLKPFQRLQLSLCLCLVYSL